MPPTPTDLAYVAGILDADGFITIQRSRHRGKIYHAPKVGITGTRRQPHDFAASFWGGNVTSTTPKKPEHKLQYLWSRTGTDAMLILEAVSPFLKIKEQQACLAWHLWEHLELGRGPDPFPCFGPSYDPVPLREEMWAEMVVLNNSRNHLRTHDARQRMGL